MISHPSRSVSSLRGDLAGATGAGLVATLFCLLLLRHDPNIFWYDDYQISILPAFTDIARSWSEGHWPLLSPYSWVCSNLAGEFQYGTFSIFVNAAVVLIWKFPLDFAQQAAALSIVHLFVLAMGGYMLARGRDLAPPLALTVALVSALNGWMICWGASDWFGALAAFAWLPWAWWALERALHREGGRFRLLLPGIFIYLLVAGGFPYTVIMLGLVTAWLAVRAIATKRGWLGPVRLGVGWLFGLGLSAPAWIALLDYAPGSRRAVEVFPPRQWVVPFSGLPGFILPSWEVPWAMFGGEVYPHPAIELACGFAPVVVLLAAMVVRGGLVLRKVDWELALLGAVLSVCMLPSAGAFRFSFRSLALFHLVLALAAAEAVRVWQLDRNRNAGAGWSVSNPGLWALVLALGAAAAAGWSPPALILVLIALLWWLAAGSAPEHSAAAAWLLPVVTSLALLASYLTVPLHSAVSRFGFNANLNSVAPLDSARLYLSIYRSPTECYRGDQTGGWFGTITRPGSTGMFAGVHLINGYTPVGPAGIGRLLDFGTHGQINPPRLAEIVLPEAGAGGLLAKLGIDGLLVASDEPLPAPLPPDWKLVQSTWEGEVWHRQDALPHVRALADERFGDATVKMIENTRQRVVADVTPNDPTRPMLITFSRAYFSGYHATLNGKPLTVTSLQGLAPTVELPAGNGGQLELFYRPRAVTAGAAVAGLSVLAAAVLLGVKRR
ncbi:MAG: hypothetical protein ACR2ID_04965 [Chthoniobacterales bacterium]